MSPAGALITALVSLFLLGGLAAWLLNVPLWLIAVVFILGGWLSARVLRRFSRGRARQKTESPH
jgi:membrane protein implicated in regulation of membrane protease activity